MNVRMNQEATMQVTSMPCALPSVLYKSYLNLPRGVPLLLLGEPLAEAKRTTERMSKVR